MDERPPPPALPLPRLPRGHRGARAFGLAPLKMRRVFHRSRELRRQDFQRPADAGSGLRWQDTRSAGGTWIRIRPSFSLNL